MGSALINCSFDQNCPRILAIDGSRISFGKDLREGEGEYYLTNTGSYAKALVSTLYDVVNEYPVGVLMTAKFDEPAAAKSLVQEYARKGDIVIFDRGYYSLKFFRYLVSLGIHPIMRIKSNTSSIIRPETDCDIELNKLKV